MRTELPKHRDIQYQVRFAWKPVYIDGIKIWLEKYVVIREYIRYTSSDKGCWSTVKYDLIENLPTRLQQIYDNTKK